MEKRIAKFNDHQTPMATVVINHRRQHGVLKMCLDAIIMQNYPNIEVVLYDFGTTDDSWSIAVSYQKAYPGILTLLRSRSDVVFDQTEVHYPNVRGRYFMVLDSAVILKESAVSHAIGAIKNRAGCAFALMGNESQRERECFYESDCEISGLDHLHHHLLSVPYPDSSIVLYDVDMAKDTYADEPYTKQAELCFKHNVVSISTPQFKAHLDYGFETIYPHFLSLYHHKLALIHRIDQLYPFIGVAQMQTLIWERFAIELISLTKGEVEKASFETALRYFSLAISQWPDFVNRIWFTELFDSLVSERYSSFWQEEFFEFYILDRFSSVQKNTVPIYGE